MQEIISYLNAEGYPVDDFIPDGKIHRFSLDKTDYKKSAFYIAHRNFSEKTGEEFYVVCYGSWRNGETKTHCTLRGVMSAADKKNINAKIDELKKREAALREKEQRDVADEVQAFWEGLPDTGSSPYLERKQINGVTELGIKYDEHANIYVPARDADGRLWSYQRISWNGDKRFHAGGRISGCFHTIGNVAESDAILVVEGLATGASVRLATGKAVVLAFTSNNLVAVATTIKRIYPNKSIIVGGDDDKWKDPERNPGREKAEAAAKATLGRAVFPKFKSVESEPTDWNDLHCLEGIDEVRAQLSGVRPSHNYFLALGFKEKEYFFTSSKNQQIVSVSKFSKADFLNLMPFEYWETVFPGQGASRVDWDAATSKLMDTARSKGIFESHNIRGAGVWEDAGRIVVNMGDHLIVDGERMGLADLKSHYFYTLGTKLPELHKNPLTAEECETVTKACELFRWKRPDFGYLLAGAMVTTRVCGALPIRPHLWLTGEKGSGKTTLFNRFVDPLIGKPLIFAGGNTSEAGIRQAVSANAVPVLFDEFENNGPKSAEHIHAILDLMRIAWSETNASIIKGGSGGTSTKYHARFAAIVTSIRQVSMTDADRSRFATIELGAHNSDLEHWKQLDTLLSKITNDFGNRLFARTIKLLPVLLKNFRTMKKALAGAGQRFGDQYGMLLAGYGVLLQDEPINDEQARLLAAQVALEDEKVDSARTDQDEALERLLTTKYSYEGAASRREASIGELIENVWKVPDATMERKALQRLGIRVDKDQVLIASGNHSEQQSIWRNTRWAGCWGNALARLPGAERTIVRIDSKPTRCVRIPVIHFGLGT